MDAEKLIALRESQPAFLPPINPFKPSVALLGAAVGSLFGATIAFVATAMIGIDWQVRLVLLAHFAMSFAILGGWIAASSMLDARDDSAAPQPLVIPTGNLPPTTLSPIGRSKRAA